MKRTVLVLFLSAVVFFAGINLSLATPITGGPFAGWDADPIDAVSISNNVATLSIQPYAQNVTSIILTRDFTGVSAISFDVNFINGASRDVPPADQGYIPNFL